MKRLLASLLVMAVPAASQAANPAQIAMGQQLFMQEYVSTEPGLNGDGLGPVFNESSCVACHNVGGVGGSGDVRSNARSLGLSEAALLHSGTPAELTAGIAKFSPGFVSASGSIDSSFPIHRRGGSRAFDLLRNESLSRFNPNWNNDDHLTCDTVHAERSAKTLTAPAGDVAITTHVFARNTTALFGLGLVDQIPDSVLFQQAKQQHRDSEVSGRPATLEDGRLGKFGWRANFATLIEFNENACAAELGLQSSRVAQPADLRNRSYRNPNPDLSDDAITAMHAFVASLPRPPRELPADSLERERIEKGEQRFAAVGCAKCHVPSLATVSDLYSDLLLHDMGPYSADFSTAPPFRTNYVVEEQTGSFSKITFPYYGPALSMEFIAKPPTKNVAGNARYPSMQVPKTPPKFISSPLGPTREVLVVEDIMLNGGRRTNITATIELVSIATVEPTFVNQEWKTPPLWGVRDSAPYMHDGRAETILEAIAMHDGEGRGSRNRFFALSYEDQQAILAFLDTFVAPKAGVIEAPKQFTRRDLALR